MSKDAHKFVPVMLGVRSHNFMKLSDLGFDQWFGLPEAQKPIVLAQRLVEFTTLPIISGTAWSTKFLAISRRLK
jgi:hypothetical protein